MIYVDLDETLVNVMVGYGNISAYRTIYKSDNARYGGLKRPLADRLLACCRELGPTKMLTMGTRDYALFWNEAFSLGFAESDIVSRYEFIEIIEMGGWYGGGGHDVRVLSKDNCPNGVLIDNQKPEEEWARAKMMWLGINADRYIKIRSFDGKDPDKFEAELSDIECKLQSLVQLH